LLKKIDKTAILPSDLKSKLDHDVVISFSFSTLEDKLARIFEPVSPTPQVRLETMQKCKEEGFLVGADLIPLLPFLSDSEENISHMIKTAKNYGADFVLMGGLTLFGDKPTDCKPLYYKILEKHFPELLPKYKGLFKISKFPPINYQRRLANICRDLCEKYQIKNRII
jgi:DNA repair photolyase